jgi:hypothetical protein
MGVSDEVEKWKHSIIYSSSKEPRLSINEKPTRGERGMLGSIRVKPRKKSDKMDPMARVNYSKFYTVAHDVKVYEFGDVHSSYLALLLAQWTWVLQNLPHTSQEEAAVEEEEGELAGEHDDDEDEEEDNYNSRSYGYHGYHGKQRNW